VLAAALQLLLLLLLLLLSPQHLVVCLERCWCSEHDLALLQWVLTRCNAGMSHK
jgi:hypothetical protein